MSPTSRKIFESHPFFWCLSQVGVLKIVYDFRYDLNLYKYTRKVEYEKTAQKPSYIRAKALTEDVLNRRSQWDSIQDGDTSRNNDHCITRLYSVLGQLYQSEKNNIASRILFDEIYSLPHEISFVKYCLTKDLTRRLAAHLTKVTKVDRKPDVKEEFSAVFFAGNIKEFEKRSDLDEFIRGSVISNRELCRYPHTPWTRGVCCRHFLHLERFFKKAFLSIDAYSMVSFAKRSLEFLKHFPIALPLGVFLIIKPIEDYYFDVGMYKDTLKALANGSPNFTNAKNTVAYIKDKENIVLKDFGISEFVRLLWELNRCNYVDNPRAVLHSLICLPSQLSILSIELVKDINKRLLYQDRSAVRGRMANGRPKEMFPNLPIQSEDDRATSERALYTREKKDDWSLVPSRLNHPVVRSDADIRFYKVFLEDAGAAHQKMVRLSLAHHRMLCKTVIMGYLANDPYHGLPYWALAYVLCDNVFIDVWFRLRGFVRMEANVIN